MKSKIHIIYIMSFSPKYEFSNFDEEKIKEISDHYWLNNEGKAVFVGRDWAFQIGENIVNYHPEITWEVWRPDVRADKVYEHTFKNGIITKSFPATKVKMWSGIRKINQIYAHAMEGQLEEYIKRSDKDKQYLLLLPASPCTFSKNFREKFGKTIPILNLHFLYSKGLLAAPKFSINPIRFVHNLVKAKQMYSHMKKVDNLLVVHEDFTQEIEKKYHCNIYFTSLASSNLDFWKSDINIEKAKDELKLKDKGHVILFSNRLVPEYQIELVLKVFKKLKHLDFFAVFTSYGSEEYVNYLKKTIQKYGLQDKVLFTDFISEDKLKLYYAACDTFFGPGIDSPGTMSVFNALLMEKQIITTDSGYDAQLLRESNAGLLINENKMNEWVDALKYAIKGGGIKIMDRKSAANHLEKREVASSANKSFVEIINNFHNISSSNTQKTKYLNNN